MKKYSIIKDLEIKKIEIESQLNKLLHQNMVNTLSNKSYDFKSSLKNELYRN